MTPLPPRAGRVISALLIRKLSNGLEAQLLRLHDHSLFLPSMNLGRHSISATRPTQIIDAKFSADCDIFTASTPNGFGVYRTFPLELVRKRGKVALALNVSDSELSTHRT